MSYLVCHFEKYKSGNLTGLQKHNQREFKNHSNMEIERSKSYLNYDLINHKPISINNRVKTIIEENRASKRAVRKDATVYCECIISSDKDFFEKLSYEDTHRFFKESLSFLEKEIGKDNIVTAIVHMDESTPHMHLGFVPMIDNSLSAKRLINRQFLRDIQDNMPKYLNDCSFDIVRGNINSKAIHTETKVYKSKLEKEINDLNTKKMELSTFLERELKKSESVKEDLYNLDLTYSEYKMEPVLFNKNVVKVNKEDFERLLEYKDILLKAENLYKLRNISTDTYKVENRALKAKILDYRNNQELFKKNIESEVSKKYENEICNLNNKIIDLERDNDRLKFRNENYSTKVDNLIDRNDKLQERTSFLVDRLMSSCDYLKNIGVYSQWYEEQIERESKKNENFKKENLKEDFKENEKKYSNKDFDLRKGIFSKENDHENEYEL